MNSGKAFFGGLYDFLNQSKPFRTARVTHWLSGNFVHNSRTDRNRETRRLHRCGISCTFVKKNLWIV